VAASPEWVTRTTGAPTCNPRAVRRAHGRAQRAFSPGGASDTLVPGMQASATNSVTIVTGVPRSGTSLVMQMLAAGGLPPLCDGVRRPDADNPRGYFEFEPAKRLARDASWLPRAAGRAVKLAHTQLASLPGDLPMRVLLVRRRLDEVLASQRVMLARHGAAPSADEDARLLPVLEAQLARLERELAARAGVAWLALEHAELVRTPELAAARIEHFLGGGLDAAAMAACVDPALHRQRR
jgi:hypothetical protein